LVGEAFGITELVFSGRFRLKAGHEMYRDRVSRGADITANRRQLLAAAFRHGSNSTGALNLNSRFDPRQSQVAKKALAE